jgi:acyl-CoA thioesterase FadM
MYPLIRLINTSIKGMLSKPVSVDSKCETSFYCMPWDLDMFLEMNNGRVLTLYDLGRFNLAIRTGLGKVLRQKRWGLVVAGNSIRYRRRIRAFEKVTMRTQVAYYDERWVYLIQSMWVKGQPASSALFRTGITEKGKTISTGRIFAALQASNWKPEPDAWIQSWVASELERPWPPAD